jgi:hypothetical protein
MGWLFTLRVVVIGVAFLVLFRRTHKRWLCEVCGKPTLKSLLCEHGGCKECCCVNEKRPLARPQV